MNDVAPETPTASMPLQMNAPRARPQRKAENPGEMDGIRRCTRRTLTEMRPLSAFPQAARTAVEMWTIELPQIAGSASAGPLKGLGCAHRLPLAPSTEPE